MARAVPTSSDMQRLAEIVTFLRCPPEQVTKVNLELLGDKYVKALTEAMTPTGVITEGDPPCLSVSVCLSVCRHYHIYPTPLYFCHYNIYPLIFRHRDAPDGDPPPLVPIYEPNPMITLSLPKANPNPNLFYCSNFN